MHDWEEISFDEVDGKGVFKFTYLSNGMGDCGEPWAVCMENDDETDLFAQDLLIELQNKKGITQLKAYQSIAEYE